MAALARNLLRKVTNPPRLRQQAAQRRTAAILLLADASGGSPADLVGYFLNFGVVGLILLDVTVTRRVFVPRWTLDREKEERERERGEKDATIAEQKTTVARLTDLAEQQVIPALTRATEVNKDYLQLLQERHRDQR